VSGEIRNPKHEIRNKSEFQNLKIRKYLAKWLHLTEELQQEETEKTEKEKTFGEPRCVTTRVLTHLGSPLFSLLPLLPPGLYAFLFASPFR